MELDINFGLKPFWFWNGEMKDDEIIRQIKEMHEKGIGGFLIHPRQGLTVPYLSKQWFDKVGVAVEGAKKYGLEAWLYDEYPYPSGIGGGEVISGHPEFEAKAIEVKKVDTDGSGEIDLELPWGVVLIAAAYPVEDGNVQWEKKVDLSDHIGICHREKIYQESGLTYYNSKRFFTGELARGLHWKSPRGKWRVYVFLEVKVDRFKYYGTFIDPLNPAATDRFILSTHEKYKQYFGHEFGKTIKGIFCDETAPFTSGFGADMPWSPLLPKMFRERTGYDLIERLPALLEPMGEDTNRVRYDFWNTVVSAFVENFDMRIHEWCRKNNILYIGEKPILRSSQLKHMDIPGTDAGHQKAGDVPLISDGIYRHSAKVACSAAHFYNKKIVLCEPFHSIGGSVTHQDMKWIYDWLSVCGINMYTPHAFYYTTDGLAKHDAPPSPFYQMPAWKHHGLLSGYVKNLWELLSSGSRKVDVLVMDPVTSSWTAMGEKKHVKKKLARDFAVLQDTMLRNHVDYYIIDTELLAQAQADNGRILVNGESYGVLVIPPVLNIDRDTMKVIERYIEQGGAVIASCCLPVENIDGYSGAASVFGGVLGVDSIGIYNRYISEDGTAASSCIQKGNLVFVPSVTDIPEKVRLFLEDDISILTGGKQNESIMAAHYTAGAKDICYIVNTSGASHRTEVRIKHASEKAVEMYAAAVEKGGSPQKLDTVLNNGYLSVSLDFSPFQSYVLVAGDAALNTDEAAYGSGNLYRLPLEGEWEIALKSMNALRLGHWNLELQNTADSSASFRVSSKDPVTCKPVIDQIADGGLSVAINLKNYFGCPKEIGLPPMECKYQMSFKADKLKELWLVMEPGSIYGQWHMMLNGHRIDPADFTNKQIYMPTNMAADISKFVKTGENSLEVFVKASRTFDGIVNPLYIFGDFGAFRESSGQFGWKLSSPAGSGKIADAAGSGIPFYAGEVEYSKMLNFGADFNGRFDLRIEDPSIQGTVSLHVNDHHAGVRSWSPYTWEIDKSWLKPKGNVVKLCVTTSLLGLFEGQEIDNITHKLYDL